MNLSLSDVIITSSDGQRFWQLKECFIRGNNVKYFQVPDEVLEQVKVDMAKSAMERESNKGQYPFNDSGRGGRGGPRGGGRGGRGGYQGGQRDEREQTQGGYRGGRGGGRGGQRGGRGGMAHNQ